MKLKILIVEDQFIEADDLRSIVEKAGHQVLGIAKSFGEALEVLEDRTPDIALLDIFLSGPRTGIDLAQILAARHIPFIYISANSDASTLNAAKATRPDGFLVKPFRDMDVLISLDIAIYRYQTTAFALETGELRLNKQFGLELLRSNKAFQHIKGASKKLLDALRSASQVATADTSVLILGETGVGKEGLALAIHNLSKRKDRPFVKINCGAIPVSLIESELFGHEKGSFTGAVEKRIGKFEQAQGGTILLDEIGEMPIETQAKLLRVIQEKELERVGGRTTIKLDIRIIAATNRNLYDEVAAGRFRIDLYYRINVFAITLPPLRDRKEDIVVLADFFLLKYAKLSGGKPKALGRRAVDQLLNYDWPGNIRELENVIERHVILTSEGVIQSIDFQQAKQRMPVKRPQSLGVGSHSIEASEILKALTVSNGKVSGKGGAAEILGISASNLVSKMKRLGIKWSFTPDY